MTSRAATAAPSAPQAVRVVSQIEAGGFAEIDNFGPQEGRETVSVTVAVGKRTFALRVHGNSMRSAGADSFPEGTIIVVEPELPPQAGDFVIALNVRKEATFKQLVVVNGVDHLRPLNRRFKTRPLGSATIVGVVREAIWRFR